MKLKIGQLAPDFTLPDQNGKTHKLSDYKGGWVLVYFYPKDDTPGCTKEACSIRDNFPKFTKSKATVLGVSVDSVKSHAKFAEKYHLPFTILADEDKSVVKKYGVYRVPRLAKAQPGNHSERAKKKFMGKEYMGTFRTSFLTDPKGKISKIYEAVKPEVHAEEVLGDLKKLSN